MKSMKVKDFCEENKIQLMVLFGSHAADKLHPKSDIDLAIKFDRGMEVSKLELIYHLYDLFDGKDIDLVILTADIEPLLLYEIFSKGILLYEKNKGVFDRERLRAWKLYLDTKKLRIVQKKYLKEFAEKKICHVA
jgi:predicted nucleotidyltransferase